MVKRARKQCLPTVTLAWNELGIIALAQQIMNHFMQNFASQLHDKLLRNTWKTWYNLITKQIQKKVALIT